MLVQDWLLYCSFACGECKGTCVNSSISSDETTNEINVINEDE